MTALLVGIVVGALLQAVTGWVTDWRAEKREHNVWVRNQRAESFIDVMRLAHALSLAAFMGDRDEEGLHAFADAMIRAQVHAPNRDALRALLQIQTGLSGMHRQPRNQRDRQPVRDGLREYDRVMRKSLGINRDDRSEGGPFDEAN